MAEQWPDAMDQRIAIVSVVLVVLALVPSGAMGATSADGLNSGQSANSPAESSVNMSGKHPQPASETASAVTYKQSDPIATCAVEDSVTGDDLSPYVDIICADYSRQNDSVDNSVISFSGDSPLWAVVIYIRIPDDIEDPKFPGGSVVVDNPSADGETQHRWPEATRRTWKSTLNVPDDAIAFVSDGGSIYHWNELDAPSSLYHGATVPNADLGFPPGVYDVQVVAYLPYEQGPPPIKVGDDEKYSRKEALATTWRSKAIANAPKKSASMTVELGGCRANFDAPEKLRALDRLQLKAIKNLFRTKVNFEREKWGSAKTAGLWAFGQMATGGPISNPAKKPAKLAAERFTDLAFPNLVDVYQQFTDSKETIDNMNAWVERLQFIDKRRDEIYNELERCHGDNYEMNEHDLPPGYEPLTHQELINAKQAGIEAARNQEGGPVEPDDL